MSPADSRGLVYVTCGFSLVRSTFTPSQLLSSGETGPVPSRAVVDCTEGYLACATRAQGCLTGAYCVSITGFPARPQLLQTHAAGGVSRGERRSLARTTQSGSGSLASCPFYASVCRSLTLLLSMGSCSSPYTCHQRMYAFQWGRHRPHRRPRPSRTSPAGHGQPALIERNTTGRALVPIPQRWEGLNTVCSCINPHILCVLCVQLLFW